MRNTEQFIRTALSDFPEDRITYQKGIATFHPEKIDELSRFFKLANREKQPLYITGFGNNISPEGERFEHIVAVKSDRLNDIKNIAEEDFYIRLGGGYPLREINKHLAPYDLWLPHGDLPYVGSVGGALAVGLTADYQGHELPLKKYFIESEIVTPEGDIIKPGSTCFKSVSGYDIVRIFAGSWGLLGFIFSATFRVMPITGKEDYGNITQNGIDRLKIEKAFHADNRETDAVYSKKIKNKFDPNDILPLI